MIVVDTGPIVALVNPQDQHHRWARGAVRNLTEPMLTCDAVLSEAFFLVSKYPNGIIRLADILASGAIRSEFVTMASLREITLLIRKYQNLPMSFADACIVRMAEIHDGTEVLTLDSHFRIYRKNGEEPVAVITPG